MLEGMFKSRGSQIEKRSAKLDFQGWCADFLDNKRSFFRYREDVLEQGFLNTGAM